MRTIVSEIYTLYPRNIRYGTNEYLHSPQLLNQKKILNEKNISKIQKDFHSAINDAFDGYFVNDFSSADYWCYEFIVLLRKTDNIMDDDIELLKSLGGVRKDILIYISKIANYYYYTFSVTSLNNGKWNFEYEDLSYLIKENLQIFNASMQDYNYIQLNTEQIKQIIPDIEMECVEMGKAKVFDLLFTDLYSHAPYNEY